MRDGGALAAALAASALAASALAMGGELPQVELPQLECDGVCVASANAALSSSGGSSRGSRDVEGGEREGESAGCVVVLDETEERPVGVDEQERASELTASELGDSGGGDERR